MNWPNFSEQELACSHTGKCEMDHDFMDTIQAIREEYGKTMYVTSAYRDISHPAEREKLIPGEHTQGLAIDLHIPAYDFLFVTHLAYKHGIRRVGWNPGKFIHLGGSLDLPQTVWTY